MGTVLILGAGATLAHAQGLRPKRGLNHPPLDGTFFERAAALARSRPEVRRCVRALQSEIKKTATFSDPWVGASPPMEQYFGDVYYEVASGSTGAFPVFVALLRLYQVVLEETTNWMVGRRQPGLVGRLIRAELDRRPGETLTILTFNHDLLIENELLTLPKRYGALALEPLYGVAGLKRLDYPPSPDIFDRVLPTGTTPLPVALHKLHGSLNWVMTSTTKDPVPGTLFPREGSSAAKRKLYLVQRKQITDGRQLKTGTTTGRNTWYLWPLVVPPIYDKHRITAMDILRDVWDSARIAVETADRLVLVGYSMPDADVSSRQMLRRAFTANADLDAVDFVNPDVGLATKINAYVRPEVIRAYRDLPGYFKASF